MSKPIKTISQRIAEVITKATGAVETGAPNNFMEGIAALQLPEKLNQGNEDVYIKRALKELLGKISADPTASKTTHYLDIINQYTEKFGRDASYKKAVEEHKRSLKPAEQAKLDHLLAQPRGQGAGSRGSVMGGSGDGGRAFVGVSKEEMEAELKILKEALAAQAKAAAQQEKDPLGALLDEVVADMNDNLEVKSESFVRRIQAVYGQDEAKKQATLQDPRIGNALKVAVEQGYPRIVKAYRRVFGEDANYQVALAVLQEQFNTAANLDQKSNEKYSQKNPGKERGVDKAFKLRDFFVADIESKFGEDVSKPFADQVEKAVLELQERLDKQQDARDQARANEAANVLEEVLAGYQGLNASVARKRAEEAREAAAKESAKALEVEMAPYGGLGDSNNKVVGPTDTRPLTAQGGRKSAIPKGEQELLREIRGKRARLEADTLAAEAAAKAAREEQIARYRAQRGTQQVGATRVLPALRVFEKDPAQIKAQEQSAIRQFVDSAPPPNSAAVVRPASASGGRNLSPLRETTAPASPVKTTASSTTASSRIRTEAPLPPKTPLPPTSPKETTQNGTTRAPNRASQVVPAPQQSKKVTFAPADDRVEFDPSEPPSSPSAVRKPSATPLDGKPKGILKKT